MHKVVERKDDIDSAVEQKLMIQAKIADQNATLSNIVISHQQHGRQKDAIQRQIHDTNNELNGLEYDKELQDLIEARNVRVRNGKEIKAKIESINSDHRMVKAMAEIESMEKHAKVLEDIDPACTSEICGLITVSLEARDNLPEAKEESLKLRKSIYLDLSIEKTDAVAEYVKAKDAVIARQAEVDKLIAVKEQINKENEERIDELDDKTEALNVTSAAVSKEIDSSMDRLGELTPLAEKLPQLVSAEAVAANLVKDIEALEVLTLKEQDTYQDAKQGIVVRIGAAKSIIDSIEINMEAETQLTDAQASLLELTKLQTQAEADKNRFANAIPQYEKEIEDLEVLEAELKATLEKTKFARGEMADWDYIRYACSKDGMRALEIEAVAPGITKNANDLLTGTFGPSHSVRFETQDDDGKEILRIIVILPDGSETPLDLQSGGEKVWILKALRLAQTLISQEKSGRHFQAALMDEEDGALSSKNAIKFIKLYRTFMGTAKMDQCCYISHRPEAVSMADNILQFRPGKITIV
jgi:DNA repair exonuclease SbcCD ATPase subunit